MYMLATHHASMVVTLIKYKKKKAFGIYIIDNKKKCWEIIKRNNGAKLKRLKKSRTE